MVKPGALKLRDNSSNLRTQAASQAWRAPNESAVSPRWAGQVPPTEEGMTQTAGSLHSSGLHSSGPEQSQAERPQATALAPSPNEDVAPGGMTLPPYPMLGGRTSQD